jgi:hypothetical protein
MSEQLGRDLEKAVHTAISFQKDLSHLHPESSTNVTVGVLGTIGGGSGVSACTVNIHGDHDGDAEAIAKKLKEKFPDAVCTKETKKTVNCTL